MEEILRKYTEKGKGTIFLSLAFLSGCFFSSMEPRNYSAGSEVQLFPRGLA